MILDHDVCLNPLFQRGAVRTHIDEKIRIFFVLIPCSNGELSGHAPAASNNNAGVLIPCSNGELSGLIAGNEAANAIHTVAKATNKLAQVGEIMAETLQDEAIQEREINKQRFLVKLEKAKKEVTAEAKTLQLEL